jgi:hypothetical protein
MKADVKGCSTCPKGEERWEYFWPGFGKHTMRRFVQYDFRLHNGKLFTCVKPTLEECREARDRALANGTIN